MKSLKSHIVESPEERLFPGALEEGDKDLLLALSKEISSCHTKEEVQHLLTKKLSVYFRFNEVMVCLTNADGLTHTCYLHTVSPETMRHPDFARGAAMKYFVNDGVFNVIEEKDEPVLFDMDQLASRVNKPHYVDFWINHVHVREMIGFALRRNGQPMGSICVYAKEKNSFTREQLLLAREICTYIGITLFSILAKERIQRQLNDIRNHQSRLEEENIFLQEQIKTTYVPGQIVGSDAGLEPIFQLVSKVAAADSTVLIQGETGTGKELIALAIHDSSPRKDKLMIKVNCAALPFNLIESELFGHEKGAFTGATERRIGKFELASGSTLFLDEIGEMAPELQVKLLRALQEKEIERIGGKTVIKTDVRIIAATNRNLQKEIEEGKFRSDLYYRLNVFPIILPPLRERKEDIPALVSHFIDRFARRSGKKITSVSPRAIQDMLSYDWPGNIRELEHVIERSVLMTDGTVIKDILLPQQDRRIHLVTENSSLKSLVQNERDHILAALKYSKGRVRGEGGAASILGLPPTTLHSKMKKLGIRKMME
jgi:transcriptional regulator with GAF, ATPase, and Fis domain